MPAAAAPTFSPRQERGLLLTLAGIQFTHIVDFMVMMPLGPYFTRLFGISDAQFGLLVSAYTLAAGLSGLLASSFVDRFERKKLLLALYVAFALATLACGLAPTYALLLGARIAAGLFGGVMGALVQTLVGDAIPFERRGRAMGTVMASFSLATVAGLPASLWLAAHLGWHAPFIAIAAASFLIAAVGLRTLPLATGHLHAARAGSPWSTLARVLREPRHWRAFAFSAMVFATGFTMIPFLTIVMTSNMGLATEQVPLVYLAGGVATLFSSRAIGAWADRRGKVAVFRAVALLALVPMLLLTHLQRVPLAVLLAATTLFFVFVSGRMVPGMALVTEAAEPALRGAFMSVNASLQAAAMGLASIVGGLLIGRDAAGLVVGYERCGWIAVVLTALAWWWAGRLGAWRAPAPPAAAVDQAPTTVS